MKQQVQIAAKMYRCQNAAKTLWGKEYPVKVRWYIETLKAVMGKEKLDELKAVLFVSKMDSVKDNAGAVMMFVAAAVEMIES